MVNASRRASVLHGASTDYNSRYATTSALSFVTTKPPPRPPASPWMGGNQSRVGYMSSGYQNSFIRDLPPGAGEFTEQSAHRSDFNGRQTATLDEIQPWKGEKDGPGSRPLMSCLRRGETKEPRFYPFKMAAHTSAEVLVSPAEEDPKARFAKPPSIYKGGQIQENATVLPGGSGITSGYAIGNSAPLVAKLIAEKQGQLEFRQPSLTMRDAERVASDSTRRYFHARDYYDNPYQTSNSYYQMDALTQREEMKLKKESLTACPSTIPVTQFALYHSEAPYAPDVGDGIGAPIPQIGEFAMQSWGNVPPEVDRVGLMPTAFSRVQGVHTGATVEDSPVASVPLPERFARMRARHDYLRWGESGLTGADRYQSTSRVELCKPAAQQPLGGFPTRPVGGPKVVSSDSSGYHYQVSQSPITPDVGC